MNLKLISVTVISTMIMSCLGKELEMTIRAVQTDDSKGLQKLYLECRHGNDHRNGSNPHPLERVSWIYTTGKIEKVAVDWTVDGSLSLSGVWGGGGGAGGGGGVAVVRCRSHARSPRHVVLVSPRLQLRLRAAPATYTPQTDDTPKIVFVQVGSVDTQHVTAGEGGEVARLAAGGEAITVTCTAYNMVDVKQYAFYMYVLIVTDAGDGAVERELGARVVTDPRDLRTWARLAVSPADHLARVSCLARWFDRDDHMYVNAEAMRSASITLHVNSSLAADGDKALAVTTGTHFKLTSTNLWVAIGVGAAGWVAAAILCGVILRRRIVKRKRSTENQPDTQELQEPKSLSRHEPEPSRASGSFTGAQVVPLYTARSLAACNLKLRAAAAGPHLEPDAGLIYSNLQELGTIRR